VSNSIDVRLQKKAVFLVTDLADFQLNSGNAQLPFLSDRLFLKSIIDMLSRFDLDLHEKVRLERPPVPIILNLTCCYHLPPFSSIVSIFHNNFYFCIMMLSFSLKMFFLFRRKKILAYMLGYAFLVTQKE
jgi:hypothetical protein